MPKRAPIEYTPAFGGGVFRAKEVVAEELAAETQDAPDAVEMIEASPDPISTLRTNERSNTRTNERTVERTIVRHSFDIGQDQLVALAEIQMERFQETGRKPKLGPLVQEALDAYIAKQRKRRSERINERTVERTNE